MLLHIGDKLGRWEIIDSAPKGEYGRRWICQCICGTIRNVGEHGLTIKNSRSCGCARDAQRARVTTHGLKKSPEYAVWVAMKQRCNNPNAVQFNDYGGRGIKVCNEWDRSFSTFITDIGRRPSRNHTLERLDNNLGYSPQNCTWHTRAQQARNNRRNILLTIGDETMCLTDWAIKMCINPITLRNRIRSGWSHTEAVLGPVNKSMNPHSRQLD